MVVDASEKVSSSYNKMIIGAYILLIFYAYNWNGIIFLKFAPVGGFQCKILVRWKKGSKDSIEDEEYEKVQHKSRGYSCVT